MSTLADNAMLVVRALTRAKKDGLSFYELHQATRLAAGHLPGILHMLEQQGWVVSALVDGIEPPQRLWHLRKQAKETFGLRHLPVSHKTLTPPCFTQRAAGYDGSFFVARL